MLHVRNVDAVNECEDPIAVSDVATSLRGEVTIDSQCEKIIRQ